MAEDQTLEQTVMLIDDEKDGTLGVICKDEKGEITTQVPTKKNQADWLTLDKNSDLFDSFMKNFMAQSKNPSHIGVIPLVKSTAVDSYKLIKEMLTDRKGNEDFISASKLDIQKYMPSIEQKNDVTQDKTSGDISQSEKKEYKPRTAEDVDWEAFKKIGISRESLEKSGALPDMLNYRRSPGLLLVTMAAGNVSLTTDARIGLTKDANTEKLIPVLYPVRKSPDLNQKVYGNTFTEEDKTNLKNTGNLGRLITLKGEGIAEGTKAFVSLDKLTNQITIYNAKNIHIPNEIKGVTLNEEQKRDLLDGKAVYLENMKAKSGKEFSAHVQVNAAERSIEFKFGEQLKKNQDQAKEIRIPNKLGGKDITPDEQQKLKEGKTIYVEGLIDKKGKAYNAYIKVNKEMGKLDFYKWNPDKAQAKGAEVKPDNDAKTQVEVNSEGKTNEATKHADKPIENGQVEQSEEQAEIEQEQQHDQEQEQEAEQGNQVRRKL